MITYNLADFLENRREIFRLKVADDQSLFVASNLSSIASCYGLATNGGNPIPFAIYADEQMVGFVMIVYGITAILCLLAV